MREDCLARVYLAILHYSTKQYHTAFDLFSSVTQSSQTQYSTHVVDSRLSPDNGNNIHIVSGLIVLCQFMIQRTPSCPQAPDTCRLTANLCSLFHKVKCGRLINDMSEMLQQYEGNIRQSKNLFILFMKSAVARLTAVRHVMSRDFSWFITMATSDFEALCAYKRGEYEHCLLLCQQSVNSFYGVTRVTTSFRLPSTDLLLLMDDDCLSLVGLCVLGGVYDNDDRYQSEYVTQLSLSLYLLVQCKLKLKHSSKSFIDVCRNIRLVYRRTPVTWVTERLLLTLAYQRALRRIIH